MAITPENDLETAMLAAAANPSEQRRFYQLLLSSELVALGSLAQSLSLETVRGPAGEFHPVFTAPSRVQALVKGPVGRFTMQGRQLFEITAGAQFVLNPGSVPDKVLTADEIAWCLKTFPPAASLVVAQPKVYPTKLVKALCILFTSRAAIKAAHLVYVAREGIDTTAHPMIGLEADDGDVPRLAQEIFEAAAAVLPGEAVEVVYLDTNGPLEPLQKHLLSVPPFYARTLPPN
jgi:hypothetical protein